MADRSPSPPPPSSRGAAPAGRPEGGFPTAEDAGAGPESPMVSTEIDPAQIGGNTRFYEKLLPDVDEVVVVNVKSIAEMGAYVTLLEYNNVEGLILLSELSRRRIRSINRLIRVGRDEVVTVIRSEKSKGYFDLSKRRVTPEDITKAEDRYAKARAVQSIIRNLSVRLKKPMLYFLENVAWPLYRKYRHAHDAFQLAVAEPETVLGPLSITEREREELLDILALKMAPQAIKIRADIQVTCNTYEGIEAIRRSLLAAEALSTEAVPITVQLVAPPLYVMLATCMDKAAGIDALTRAIEVAEKVIKAEGGALAVKRAPTVTSSHDDSDLQRMLDEIEEANREVSGDDETEDEDEDEALDEDDVDIEAKLAEKERKAKEAMEAGLSELVDASLGGGAGGP